MSLPIRTAETNQRRHRVRLEEPLLHALLAQAVADQVRVDLEASNVSFRVFISTNVGSLAPTRYHAEVEITEDFSPAEP